MLPDELLANGAWTEAGGHLILNVADGIAYATVNRPGARNPMSSPVRLALVDFLARIRDDSDVRVLLLQAAGDTFISGGDIKAFAEKLKLPPEARAEDLRARAAGAGVLSMALATLPQPVVVAARGHAVGFGASIVFAADFALLSENAQLRLSHVTLGLAPDGAATWFLPRQVGLKRASRVAMLGEAISAQEAVAIGLATAVVPDAELEAAAERLARRLADGPREALVGIKQLLRQSSENGLASQAATEADALGRCALTDDYAEGVRALLEKRPARFGQRRNRDGRDGHEAPK